MELVLTAIGIALTVILYTIYLLIKKPYTNKSYISINGYHKKIFYFFF
jgi:hypothetical protein